MTDEKMDKATLEKIKKELLQRKEQIVKDLEDISRSDSHEVDNRTAKFPEYGNKADENAQEISEYSTTVATEAVLEKTLRDIENALDRMEKETYGICKYCGKHISKKRLEARPVASTCIECKTKLQND